MLSLEGPKQPFVSKETPRSTTDHTEHFPIEPSYARVRAHRPRWQMVRSDPWSEKHQHNQHPSTSDHGSLLSGPWDSAFPILLAASPSHVLQAGGDTPL